MPSSWLVVRASETAYQRRMNEMALRDLAFAAPIALAATVLAAAQAEAEQWNCHLYLAEHERPADVRLAADLDAGTGTVEASGLPPVETLFRIAGFKRRWDWLEDGGTMSFAFTVKAHGTEHIGQYYEFTGRDLARQEPVEPTTVYFCHRSS